MTVRLTDLTIRFGSVLAVDSVTAEFPSGAVGLLGQNGAGKSSIIKALLGLIRPESGEMDVLGVPRHEIRRVVGYMPEREAHIPRLNGYETVRLAAELSGLPRSLAARRAHEVLYFAGLDEQRYRLVSTYSTGMKQKVKLAVALAHDPKVLLLDEPTNGLDPGGRRDMLRLVRELATTYGKSVILSSHILSDVEEVCSHVVLIGRGRLLRAGSVRDLTRHETRKLHVTLGGDAVSGRAGLERLGGAQAVVPDGPGRFTVEVSEATPSREVFAAVQAAGGVVRELREHHRSLEEVFLSAVVPAAESREEANP
ncbi:MAG: ABC transporter ATP-binding protein [Planctomycetes bacterium]|nr:ABC transporter ATP-binding protein [Planctomycetota bacterium]MCB9889238.1 ABC transporter ATP-binding protein [Planctomycetota bacterium]